MMWFGCPLDIHNDQELCQLLEICKTVSSAINPRCNGKVERFSKTLVRMIRAYLKGQLHLGCLAAAYRATPQESTGIAPNILITRCVSQQR